MALTRVFSEDAGKRRQWHAFLNKNRVEGAALGDTISLLDDLLWPPTQAALRRSAATATWRPDLLKWV